MSEARSGISQVCVTSARNQTEERCSGRSSATVVICKYCSALLHCHIRTKASLDERRRQKRSCRSVFMACALGARRKSRVKQTALQVETVYSLICVHPCLTKADRLQLCPINVPPRRRSASSSPHEYPFRKRRHPWTMLPQEVCPPNLSSCTAKATRPLTVIWCS